MSASGDGVIDAPFLRKANRPNVLGPEIGSVFGGLRRVSVAFRAYIAICLVWENALIRFASADLQQRPSQARGLATEQISAELYLSMHVFRIHCALQQQIASPPDGLAMAGRLRRY